MSLYHIALVGDSDISRWPTELFPSPSKSPASWSVVRNGLSGACLEEITGLVAKAVADIAMEAEENERKKNSPLILVMCAGENDIGQGYSIDKIIRSFERCVDECFAFATDTKVIFLGPKLEPWLTNDHSSRKKYIKLSKAFQRAVERHIRKGDEITHPQAASTRGANLDGVGNHPNAWFAASVSYHNAKSGGTSSSGTVAAALGATAPAAKMEAASPNAKSEDSKQAAVL